MRKGLSKNKMYKCLTILNARLLCSVAFLLIFSFHYALASGWQDNGGIKKEVRSKVNNKFALKKSVIKDRSPKERILLNNGWRFYRYKDSDLTDSLIYDVRPVLTNNQDDRPADARPTEAVDLKVDKTVLKPWILPTGNRFIKDPSKRYVRPAANPGSKFPFVQMAFNDKNWEKINLPHDWAIKGPFYKGENTEIGGGMGRLPVHGVAWYRKMISIPKSDSGKSIFLDVDGAMSYAMVWINGKLAGGWPYGYNSWRVDLTPYIIPGGNNQLAIRLDNPAASSRWYPGGGIYRNVWLTKVSPLHVSQWGTVVTTRNVSSSLATVDLKVSIDNDSHQSQGFKLSTEIFLLNTKGAKIGPVIANIRSVQTIISPGKSDTISGSVIIDHPKLWNPLPSQIQNRYMAVTTIFQNGKPADVYETFFGIRNIKWDASHGVFINGEKVFIKGVNQHHDLGALGAAFNVEAAQRQLNLLKEMGCNAIRLSHNPPAPELLELTDRMGFLVLDEIFDSWALKKTPLDFHLVFPEWHEQDLRSMIRRYRNHPSVFMWSFGNEVGEQYTGEAGGIVAKELYQIVKEEDPTRPGTVAMNFAKPNMPLPQYVDAIGLNYQGEGIRNAPAYSGLKGISTPPLYPAFRDKFSEKVIISTENAAALSSRGEYFFPVFNGNSSPVKDGSGGNSQSQQISSYELYSVDFGASADKVFATMDAHPFVAGGFVWTGWDYLGEPTPYYLSRSSYFGIIDLAGFKKDRFYLYQSVWRPELPMAHILPHWNWPERIGMVTPVHVFTSGDEAELFLNGKSLGRKKKEKFEYRLRWDDVQYNPGKLKVISYKKGRIWASETIKTSGSASRIRLSVDSIHDKKGAEKLVFVVASVEDKDGQKVSNAKDLLQFTIEGPAKIIATDNGDPASLVSFSSHDRQAFNGVCLLILRLNAGRKGPVKIKVRSGNINGELVLASNQ